MQRLILTATFICQTATGAQTDVAATGSGNTPPTRSNGLTLFESKIRPALIRHCYQCHSAATKSPKGGLLLDSREGSRRGGDSGPAVVPGKPAESLLLTVIAYDGDVQMPPDGKLPTDLIEDFRRWISGGATDPRDSPSSTVTHEGADGGIEFWSLQPLERAEVPSVDDAWIRTDIDRFIWAKLVERGLRPQPVVTRRLLIRRAYFDLLGLPPTPGQIDSFVNDDDPRAYEKLIDRLLESPHYGERWGRHWLDVARYADSSGYEDGLRPTACLPLSRFRH